MPSLIIKTHLRKKNLDNIIKKGEEMKTKVEDQIKVLLYDTSWGGESILKIEHKKDIFTIKEDIDAFHIEKNDKVIFNSEFDLQTATFKININNITKSFIDIMKRYDEKILSEKSCLNGSDFTFRKLARLCEIIENDPKTTYEGLD